MSVTMDEEQTSQPRIHGYIHEAPFETSTLQVDSIHTIYYEQYGLKDGLPGTHDQGVRLVEIPNI